MHGWLRGALLAALVGAGVAVPHDASAAATGTTLLIDDTGTIALRIPEEWRDVDITPGLGDDGRPRGRLAATPDQFELQATGHVPLVWATVVPAPADPVGWLAHNTLHSRCVGSEPDTFDNGLVLGIRVSWTGCGTSKARVVQVAARSKDNHQAAVVVQVMLPRQDDELLDLLLGSVDVFPSTAEGPAPPTDDPVVHAADPALPLVIDRVPADVVSVVDDTHGVAVSVPPHFTDTVTQNDLNDDGSQRPTVFAAPDLGDFLANGADGVIVIRLPHIDPATLLDNTGYSICDDGGYFAVSARSYKGFARLWEDCAGPVERLADVALVPADRSATVLVTVALPGDDLSVLQIAIASVELL